MAIFYACCCMCAFLDPTHPPFHFFGLDFALVPTPTAAVASVVAVVHPLSPGYAIEIDSVHRYAREMREQHAQKIADTNC